jgi:hypothetical protein
MEERYFSAAELADYEYCPLAWWEEQTNALADLTPEELSEHIADLRQRYGENAMVLPEYQLVLRLLARHDVLDEGRAAHEAHAGQVAALAVLTPPLAPPLIWRAALLLAIIVLLALGLLLWLR